MFEAGTTFNGDSCTTNSDCPSGYPTCAQRCRSRTVGLCWNSSNGYSNKGCVTTNDCASGSTCQQNVWKLGDIIYSTPKVQEDYMYCSNGTSFNSQTCSPTASCTDTTFNSCKKKESVIFVGANDGMLHAFKTGILSTNGVDPSLHQVERVVGDTPAPDAIGIPTQDMGKELWAFIPKNSLPYLRCLATPPTGGNACHLYYNDLSPYITKMGNEDRPYRRYEAWGRRHILRQVLLQRQLRDFRRNDLHQQDRLRQRHRI